MTDKPCHYPMPKRVIRAGRACWLCRECGADVSLHLVFMAHAGASQKLIDFTTPSDYMPRAMP